MRDHLSVPAVRRLPLARPAALAGVLAVLLTVYAVCRPLPAVELALLRAVQRVDPGPAAWPLAAVDLLTSAVGAVVMWVVLLVLFAVLRWWPAAPAMLVLPFGGLVDNVIGLVAHRDRPVLGEALRVASGTDADSFPSGHVLGAVLLYGLLFALAGRLPGRMTRWTARALCLAMMVSVGPVRLWVGAHWPSDVLAGYLYGLALLPLPLAVERAATERRAMRTIQEERIHTEAKRPGRNPWRMRSSMISRRF